MIYSIIALPQFVKDLKRLSKKYPKIGSDIIKLTSQLQENPTMGVMIKPGLYKLRMSITGKSKGKSAGSRILTYVIDSQSVVYLLTIYDKAERDEISDNDIIDLLSDI